MRINDLVDELKKINLAEHIADDRDEGLDLLLQEFVFDVQGLSGEEQVRRTRIISECYYDIYNRYCGMTDVAINQTVKAAIKITEHDDKSIASDINDLIKVQKNDPIIKKEEYFRGLANGLIVAKSVVDGTDPKFVDAKESVNETVDHHDYSNTQIKANKDVADEVIRFSMKIPENELYTDPDDPQYGRELYPHITIKWGLTTNDPKEIEDLLDDSVNPFQIVFGKVSMFSEDDKPYDVLKVDMDSGDNLQNLHDLFSTLENEDSHSDYIPHMTIAYVKKGEGKKYVDNKHFVGLEMGVDCFEFRDQNGNSTQIVLGSNEDNFDKVSPDRKQGEVK